MKEEKSRENMSYEYLYEPCFRRILRNIIRPPPHPAPIPSPNNQCGGVRFLLTPPLFSLNVSRNLKLNLTYKHSIRNLLISLYHLGLTPAQGLPLPPRRHIAG